MGVRPHQHRVADHERMVRPAAQDGMLHDHHVAADRHRPRHGVDDDEVEDPRPRSDGDVAVEDGMR